MRLVRSGCAVASTLLVACGSGSLGSVQGHDISTKRVVYLDTAIANQVVLMSSSMDNLCEVFTGTARPVNGVTLMVTQLANWTGNSIQPLVSGTYVQTASPTAPGLVSETIVQWGSGCVAYSATQASSGSVRVESFGGLQAGGHLVADVDLKFGDDHLSGPLDAVYCGKLGHPCGL